MKYIDKIMGCLYGGAIGDALGYPVEFLSTKEIVEIYGRDGIRDYACSEGKALISDDTQMTLFTLGGLLAWRGDQERGKNKDSWKEYVWKSYQDWLFTQDKNACPHPPGLRTSLLCMQKELRDSPVCRPWRTGHAEASGSRLMTARAAAA